MIRQPSIGYFRGSAKYIQMQAEELSKLRNTIVEIYAQNTGQPLNVIQEDLERDNFMSAKKSLSRDNDKMCEKNIHFKYKG
jgi:ATP-dependent Clp protease, protease subunit